MSTPSAPSATASAATPSTPAASTSKKLSSASSSAVTSSTSSSKKSTHSKLTSSSASTATPTTRKLSTKPCTPYVAPAQSNIDFSLATPSTGTPQPVWPIWTQQRAQKEGVVSGGVSVSGTGKGAAASSSASSTAVFTDPDGLPTLPPSLSQICSGWKRLQEFYPTGVAERMTVTPSEGAQTMHHVRVSSSTAVSSSASSTAQAASWNHLVTSQLNLILSKRKLFTDTTIPLWSSITPQHKDGVVRYNTVGKYTMKVWHQNEWRLIVVDDMLPYDEDGKCLLPQCTNQMEIWPLLASKVLLKVWQDKEFGAGNSGGTEILYTLCGWICQHSIASDTLLSYPYSKSNRPSSPSLPFNPLMIDTTNGASTSGSENIYKQIMKNSMSVSGTAAASNSTGSQAPSRGTTPQTTSVTSITDKETIAIVKPQTGHHKKKPSSATSRLLKEKDRNIEDDETTSSAASSSVPLTTEHLHTYSSRRGELGWFNELVYAAPGSTTSTSDSMGAGSTNASGLLFAYVWSYNNSTTSQATNDLTSSFSTLSQALRLDTIETSSSSSSSSSSATSSSSTAVVPKSLPLFGATQYEWDANAALSAATTGTTPSTPAKEKGVRGAAESKKDTAIVSASATTATAEPLRIDAHIPATATTTSTTSSSVPRFQCFLVEAFDANDFSGVGVNGEDGVATSTAITKVTGITTGKASSKTSATTVSSQQPPSSSGGGRIGTAGGNTNVPQKKGDASASVTSANKASSQQPGSSPVLSTKIVTSEDASKQVSSNGHARAFSSLAGSAPAVPLSPSSLAAAKTQQRMEAWLRGEERELAQEEHAATTPQLCLTDLITGKMWVAKVDLFTSVFPHVSLVRSVDRYTYSTRVSDMWCSLRDGIKKPFSTKPSVMMFVPDCATNATTNTGMNAAINQTAQSGILSSAIPTIDIAAACASGVPLDSAQALQSHYAAELAHAKMIEQSVMKRRLFVHVEMQTNIQVTSGAVDGEQLTHVLETAATMKGGENNATTSSSSKQQTKPVGTSSSSTAPTATATPSQPKLITPRPASGKSSSVSQGGGLPTSNKSTVPTTTISEAPLAPPLQSKSSSTNPNVWSIRLEKFDWLNGKCEVVEEKKFDGSENENVMVGSRLACIEFILPPSEPSAALINGGGGGDSSVSRPLSAHQTQPTQPSSPKSGSKAKTKVIPTQEKSKTGAKGKDTSSSTSLTPSTTSLPDQTPGQLYRVVITSTFGYAMTVFSQDIFELEEGKPGMTQMLQQWASGEMSNASGSTSSSSASSNKKDALLPHTLHGNTLLTLSPASLLERMSPSPTYVKTVEGSYPSQQPGSFFVLFKYVLELGSTAGTQSTLLSTCLSFLDTSILPYLRYELINNDTFESTSIGLEEGNDHYLITPLTLASNAHGYTLVCSCTVGRDFSLFSSRYFIRLVTSRPLTSFVIENPSSNQTGTVEEYKQNQAKNVCRVVVVGSAPSVAGGTTSVGSTATPAAGKDGAVTSIPTLPATGLISQGLLYFNFPSLLTSSSASPQPIPLICRIYNLDETLEYPLASPPRPLLTITSNTQYGQLIVPVFLVTKEYRLLVDVSFDLDTANTNGISFSHLFTSSPPQPLSYSLRFLSTTPLTITHDRSYEDELSSIKASWGDAARNKRARQVREQWLEVRKEQVSRYGGTLPQIQKDSVSSTTAAPTTPATSSTSRDKKDAQPLHIPPIPLPPIVRHSSSVTIPPTETLDSLRKTQYASDTELARRMKQTLDAERDALSQYIHKTAEQREVAYQTYRTKTEETQVELMKKRNEIRKQLVAQDAELNELRACIMNTASLNGTAAASNESSSATGTIQYVGNYDECNASHTPFTDLVSSTTLVTNSPGKEKEKEKDKDREKENKDKVSGSGTSGTVGKDGIVKKLKSNADSSSIALSSTLATDSTSSFGLALYLSHFESSLPSVSSMPPWKGGSLLLQAIRRIHEILQESLRTPIVQAIQMHAYREGMLLSQSSGGGSGGTTTGNPTATAPATPSSTNAKRATGEKGSTSGSGVGSSSKESRSTGAAGLGGGSSTLDSTVVPLTVDRHSLANSLWHSVYQTRRMLPKVSESVQVHHMLLSAEVVLLALSLEQLERACSTLNNSAATPSATAATASEKGIFIEEEKSNDTPLPAAVTVSPIPPPIAKADKQSGGKASKNSNNLAQSVAPAVVAPVTDYAAIEAWLGQLNQYHHLYSLSVPVAHSQHPSGLLASSPTSSRPASGGAEAMMMLQGEEDEPKQQQDAPLQWLGDKEPKASVEEEKETTASSSSHRLPPQLPLSSPMSISTISSCVALAASSLGRDTIVHVLSSLPPTAGVSLGTLLSQARIATSSLSTSSGAAAAIPASLSCCGACFLHGLLTRVNTVTETASNAMKAHRIEQQQQQQAAAAAIVRSNDSFMSNNASSDPSSPFIADDRTITPTHSKKSSINLAAAANKNATAAAKKITQAQAGGQQKPTSKAIKH